MYVRHPAYRAAFASYTAQNPVIWLPFTMTAEAGSTTH